MNTSKKLIQNDQIDIIDIGSNIGVHSLNFAFNFKNSKIYSIEPTNFAFKKLLKNLSLNPKIQCLNKPIFYYRRKNKPEKIYSSWDLKQGSEKHKKHLGIKNLVSLAETISLDEFVLKQYKQKLN